MMMNAAVMQNAADQGFRQYDYRHLERVREKFREIFGSTCPLRDEMILQRYDLTPDGELVMFVR